MGDQLALTIVAVIGSLGGGLLGGWFTARRDNLQWARQQQQRNDEAFLKACADFLATAIECRRLLEQLFQASQLQRGDGIVTHGNAYTLKTWDLHREAAMLRLLGASKLLNASDGVIQRAGEAFDAIKLPTPLPRADHEAAAKQALEALKAAIVAFIDEIDGEPGRGKGGHIHR